MNRKWQIIFCLFVLAMLAVGLQIYPAFINQYYNECLAQNLAPVCYVFKVPSLLEVWYYLAIV